MVWESLMWWRVIVALIAVAALVAVAFFWVQHAKTQKRVPEGMEPQYTPFFSTVDTTDFIVTIILTLAVLFYALFPFQIKYLSVYGVDSQVQSATTFDTDNGETYITVDTIDTNDALLVKKTDGVSINTGDKVSLSCVLNYQDDTDDIYYCKLNDHERPQM